VGQVAAGGRRRSLGLGLTGAYPQGRAHKAVGTIETLSSVLEEVVAACRVLTRLGLVAGFGHVSARLPNGNLVITPRKALGLVQVEELVQLAPDGTPVSSGRPPLEAAMHVAVYQRRPDVQAICRTHSKFVNVFGLAGRPIEVVHGFGCELRGRVDVYPDALLVSDARRGKAVAERLGSAHALVLRGNGCLVVGESVGESCVKAIFLEESAELQYLAQLLGPVSPLDPAVVAERLQSDLPHEPIRAWEFYRARYGGREPLS
jgi:ribulose-5-phosphate 4-epimerase/fuculose-1-phosphate aldolase